MSPVPDLASFPPLETAGRLGRLRQLLSASEKAEGAEALLVTKPQNIRYLTGFSGSAAMLLVLADGAAAPRRANAGPPPGDMARPGGAVLFTDGRYGDQAASELAAAGVLAGFVVDRLPAQLTALEHITGGLRAVAVEEDALSWGMQLRLARSLRGAIVPSGSLVEQLRLVKDPGELARIEAACDIADVALAQVKEHLRARCTEAELAAELEREMRRRGAAYASFETIVASGPNGARPHARPTERVIETGDLVVVDFGATVDGYHSDMTRTLCAGTPDSELTDLLDAVFVAQRAGVRALRAGVGG
ncbi:MAG TPA: Xaa-Pro peptidase family protein, partial [Acidimicrobiales bacterium]|nr:Xaa-Pro peptidase family protein [Acidimicrobiales bacterium]